MGVWALPQLGAGVWVEFEQGDPDHPIWSGCWFGSAAEVPAMALSYAQQRALEIGVTIAGGARVILLDEPTAGMSRAETSQFIALIRQVTAGRTLLMVEHDMGVVFDLADRVAVLVGGELLTVDTPAAVRADPRVQQAYLGAAAQPVHGP